MGEEQRGAGGENEEPEDEDGPEGVGFGADWNGSDGVNDGQVAVEGHEHQRVDTGVGRHHHQVLDNFAPDVTERPEEQSVISRREGDAQDDEEEVGHRQVDDQQVGRVPHLQHVPVSQSLAE